MALVAYDCSDESENEHDEEIVQAQNIVKEVKNLNNKEKSDNSKLEISDDEDEITGLPSKSFLPTPSHSITTENVDEDQSVKGILSLELAPLKNKSTGRFTDLSSMKSRRLKLSSNPKSEEDKEVIKKLNPLLQTCNGLLSVLPPPKNESSNENKISKPLLPYKFLKSKPMGDKNVEKKSKDDEDEDIELGSDFFSLNKDDSEDLPEPIDIDIPLPSMKKSLSDYLKSEPVHTNMDTELIESQHSNITPENTSHNPNNPLNLDNETMQRYFGRKRKGENLDDIQIIDVRQDEMLAESKRLLTKNLTQEGDSCSSHRKLGGFSSLSRRKHQITYLAFQAKEREVELKNMWAQNRLTKKQTQQKYGF